MAVPKRKTSRMKKRQRKAANRYEGVQANFCTNCSAPAERTGSAPPAAATTASRFSTSKRKHGLRAGDAFVETN